MTAATGNEGEWMPMSVKPEKPIMAVLFYGDGKHAPGWSMKEPIRDERFEMAYFTDGEWRRCGTGHEVFESWADEYGHVPTHYREIEAPAPPLSESDA